MKPLSILLLCAVFLPPCLAPQTRASQEQMSFGSEGVFLRPVPLPSGALQALRASKSKEDILQECAKAERIQPSEIPAAWFVASRIQLDGASASDFVVRGEQ
jgi:hypothetical protein